MLKVLYRTYVVLVFMPLFVVLTIITALVTAIGCMLGGERFFSYYPGMLWSRITLALLFCPVTIHNRELLPKGKPSLVTANHTSSLDIFLMYGYLGVPFKWVMKASLRKLPFVGWTCEKCGFIYVDNSTPAKAKAVVEAAEQAIEEGYSIFIFPEGARTLDGKLGKLKRGAFKMAMDTSAPVVPITIKGGYEALPRYAKLPTPHRLTLTVHPAIDSTQYPQDARGLVQLSEEVRRVFEASLSA